MVKEFHNMFMSIDTTPECFRLVLAVTGMTFKGRVRSSDTAVQQ